MTVKHQDIDKYEIIENEVNEEFKVVHNTGEDIGARIVPRTVYHLSVLYGQIITYWLRFRPSPASQS